MAWNRKTVMKKNQGSRPTPPSISPRRAKLRLCKTHQVYYLKQYPHVCEGDAVETKETLKGRKKGRA
jgi:hypothetical protein